MNPVQGSNHEMGNEHTNLYTSSVEDDARVIQWPDERLIHQLHINNQYHNQENKVFKVDRLREKLHRPEWRELLADLNAYGEQAVSEPMPPLTFNLFRQFSKTGNRKSYERVYFDRRGRLAAVSLLALDDNSPDVLHVLEEMLWAVCDEYTWCLPAHLGTGEAEQVEAHIDLFAAETVHMLAEIATLHGQHLDPLIVERIGMEAERRIFTPLYREQRAYHWQTADHNWSAVCGGCCGMAALLLVKDEAVLRESTRQTIHCMEAFLSGYGEDGGCAEGIGYWVYGFGYFIYYAEMLLDYSEGALNLLTDSKAAAIAAFPLRIHLSEGTYVNYSDSAEQEEIPSGLLSRLAARFGLQMELPLRVPRLTDDPCRRWAHLLRNVMWSDPAVVGHGRGEAAVQASRGGIFHQLGWMVAKSALQRLDEREETDHPRSGSKWVQAACSFKGGHNDEPHNHLDLGQVIIHCGGENILCDPGAGLYTQAYFAPGREQLFHISSSGHNVPLIEGCEQSPGREAEAKVLEFRLAEDGSEMQAILDLTRAYPEAVSLQRYTRHLCWRAETNDAGIHEFGFIGMNGIINADVDVAALRITDRFQWDMNPGADAVKFSADERYAVPSPVVERWISRICPVVKEEGLVQWRASRANMYMTYDAVQWEAQVESVHAVDHDEMPVTFYRTSLIWKGTEKTVTKYENGRGTEKLELSEPLKSLKLENTETPDHFKLLGKKESRNHGDAVYPAGVETDGAGNSVPLEIVCQVDFIVEPRIGETEVSPRE
ncbi:heparinase II/III family protein [Paenibacillus sp. AN1007]|uniref:Heparinase II/III family protein n=1 Tax=Paenibacillus sp. AN1007 TaxID=3151385 RepID=A0AAU8N9B2_9BACL